MKLLIGVLFLMAQLPSANSFILNCTYSSEEIEGMEYKMNFDRKMFAHNYEVMNMEKLKYDPSLTKYASNYKSCDDLKNATGRNGKYRIDGRTNEEAFEAVTSFIKNYSKNKKVPQWIDEDLNPDQTTFARCRLNEICAQISLKLEDGEVIKMASENVDITFYGQKSDFSMWNFHSGPPGYMCQYGHEDGLCLSKGAKKC